MLCEDTLFGRVDKVLLAIKRLQLNEPPDVYYVALSGGKGSSVALDLCKRAGVKFDAHYNITISANECSIKRHLLSWPL